MVRVVKEGREGEARGQEVSKMVGVEARSGGQVHRVVRGFNTEARSVQRGHGFERDAMNFLAMFLHMPPIQLQFWKPWEAWGWS